MLELSAGISQNQLANSKDSPKSTLKLSFSTLKKKAKFQVLSTDHGSTNISQKDGVFYLYLHMGIYTRVPTHTPVNRQNNIMGFCS